MTERPAHEHAPAHVTGRLRRLVHRIRTEHGMGLIELLIAMTVLNIGVFATLGAFSSGYVALRKTKAVSSASVIQDAQMERFRAFKYTSVCLSTTSTDSAYVTANPEGTAVPTCVTSDPAMVAVRVAVTGPDSRSYRVDTYIVWRCITGTMSTASPYSTAAPGCTTASVAVANPTKLVRIVVRDNATPATVLARAESIFDQSTGL